MSVRFKSYLIFTLTVTFSICSFNSFAGMKEDGLEYLLFEDIPIVSAGFFTTSTKKAPGSVTIIKLKKRESPVRTLSDVIEYYAPGMVIGRLAEAGPAINARGIMVDSNAKTLVMLDGMHLNHRQHFGYSNEMSLPLLGDIGTVEITNGPGAIVHGSGAINGFVNLIPKNGTEYSGFDSRIEYGFEDESKLIEASYGFSYGDKKDLFIYAGWVEASGSDFSLPWNPYDPGNAGLDWMGNRLFEPYLTGANTVNPMYIDDSYKLSVYWNHDNFKLDSFYQESHIGSNGYVYGGEWGDTPVWMTAQAGLRPTYTFIFNETDSMDLLGTLLFMQQGRESSNATVWTAPKGYDTENLIELKLVGKTIRFENHSLAGGVSYGQRNFDNDNTYFSSKGNSGTEEAATTEWNELSLFLEEVYDVTEKWVASFGVRYDKIYFDEVTSYYGESFDLPDSSDNTSVRVATAYEVDPTLNIKLSYQQGFRYLDAAYLNYYVYFSSLLNQSGFSSMPDFKPEKMDSWEINLSKELVDMKVALNLNLYYNTYKDMLNWIDYDESYVGPLSYDAVLTILNTEGWLGAHGNVDGEFKSIGGELSIKWTPFSSMVFNLIYGYSKPESVSNSALKPVNLFTSDKSEWTRYPKHSVKTVVENSFFDDKLKTGLAIIYGSGIDYKKASNRVSSVYGDDRFIVDVSANYSITENLSAKLIGKNIFESDVPQYAFTLPYSSCMGQEKSYWYLSASYKY